MNEHYLQSGWSDCSIYEIIKRMFIFDAISSYNLNESKMAVIIFYTTLSSYLKEY